MPMFQQAAVCCELPDGGSVYLGKSRLLKRQGCFRIVISRKMYRLAPSDFFLIRTGYFWERRHSGEILEVCWENESRFVRIERQIRVHLVPAGNVAFAGKIC